MPISKAQIKRLKALHQAKFRQAEQMFLVEGKKGVEEALASQWEVKFLYSTDEQWVKVQPNAECITSVEMEQISALNSPSEHLACVTMKTFESPQWTEKTLYLDGIRDPGNLGTIIRSADWFGWRQVVLSKDCVDFTNPKVVQSTMGSLFHVSIFIDQEEKFLLNARQQDMAIWGADLKGEELKNTHPTDNAILVIGSESHGIRPSTAQWVQNRVTISSKGEAESLNAAIATSIILYQWS